MFRLSPLSRSVLQPVCSSPSLIGVVSVRAQVSPSLSVFAPSSRQHTSQRFPFPYIGFKCVPSPFTLNSTSSPQTKLDNREREEGESGMIVGEKERRQGRCLRLDGGVSLQRRFKADLIELRRLWWQAQIAHATLGYCWCYLSYCLVRI